MSSVLSTGKGEQTDTEKRGQRERKGTEMGFKRQDKRVELLSDKERESLCVSARQRLTHHQSCEDARMLLTLHQMSK